MFGWVVGIESEPTPDLGSRGRGLSNFGSSGSGVLPDNPGPLPDSKFRDWMLSSRERASGSESSGIRTIFGPQDRGKVAALFLHHCNMMGDRRRVNLPLIGFKPNPIIVRSDS